MAAALRRWSTLPKRYAVLGPQIHLVAPLHRKGIVEAWHVHDDAVDAVLLRRVRIGFDQLDESGVACLAEPALGIPDVEPPVGTHAVDDLRRAPIQRSDIRFVGNLNSCDVRD